MDIHEPFLRYFRKRRLARFKRLFPESRCKTVLDVGGTPRIWRMFRYVAHITLLNRDGYQDSEYQAVIGDACQLPYAEGSFDLAFSNSVIEHVEDQQSMADELRRVGRYVYCQTPCRWFPVEPHFIALFVHWLPASWGRWKMLHKFSLHFLLNRGSEPWTEPVYWLSKQDMKRLFPDCEILTERFFGWPKSFIAVRRP